MRVEGTHKRENANEVGKLGAEQTEEAREVGHNRDPKPPCTPQVHATRKPLTHATEQRPQPLEHP